MFVCIVMYNKGVWRWFSLIFRVDSLLLSLLLLSLLLLWDG